MNIIYNLYSLCLTEPPLKLSGPPLRGPSPTLKTSSIHQKQDLKGGEIIFCKHTHTEEVKKVRFVWYPAALEAAAAPRPSACVLLSNSQKESLISSLQTHLVHSTGYLGMTLTQRSENPHADKETVFHRDHSPPPPPTRSRYISGAEELNDLKQVKE